MAASGVVALPAGAIELGEAQMVSTMGQPLRATIAYSLGPNEQIYDHCIQLLGRADAAIPAVTRARVTITADNIVLTGQTPVRDPLLDLRVAVDCPYTPTLVREFTLIVDPGEPANAAPVVAEVAESSAAAPAQARVAPQPVVSPMPDAPATEQSPVATPPPTESAAPSAISAEPAAAPVAAAVEPVDDKPQFSVDGMSIAVGSQYRVVSGDTTSLIASRVEGRTMSLAPAVALLAAMNPAAFVDGDPNKLMSGSLLMIPDLSSASTAKFSSPPTDEAVASTAPVSESSFETAAPVETAVAEVPAEPAPVVEDSAPVEDIAETPAADSPESAATSLAVEPDMAVETPDPAIAEIDESPADQPVPAEAVESMDTADPVVAEPGLRPGDVVMTEPAAPVVRPAPAGNTGGIDWMRWGGMGGAGLLALIGLFFGGRKLKDKFGSTPIAPAMPAAADEPEIPAEPEKPQEPVTQAEPFVAEEPEPAAEPMIAVPAEAPKKSIVDDVDFEFADTIAADEISLDADLDAGTGLQEGAELDVAQDFGFSPSDQAANEFDLEITEAAAREPEQELTDVNPATQSTTPAPAAEAAAGADDDEYDMSMIVDATRQTIDEDLTEKDLNAIPVEDKVEAYSVSNETMQTEVDLQILEQDYQDEYTATLAASKEIEEAAAELALELADPEPADAAVTAKVPAAPDLELTAEMPFDVEPTREMPADPAMEPTLNMAVDPGMEPTREMPADPGMEPTREMVADPGMEATREMAASPELEPTAVAPLDPGLDPTAEMSVSTSDSGVNAELTSSIPVDVDALNDALTAGEDAGDDEDVTARIAAAGSDVTVEMPAREDGSTTVDDKD
jgi:hypothetical protein